MAHEVGTKGHEEQYRDFSGVAISGSANPYQALIDASNNDPKEIQAIYSRHRSARIEQQTSKLLSPDFEGAVLDATLVKLLTDPNYKDPRYCLVFWARPPQKLKSLIATIQAKLREAVPDLWLMPPDNLHMTSLEVTHSRTEPEIAALLETLSPSIETITDHTYTRRARLVKPLLGFDASAVALSFLPAAGEAIGKDRPDGRRPEDDAFTYHHLRRDLYDLSKEAGVTIDSRYTVPSAHLTVGRFVTKDALETDGKVDSTKVKRWVDKIQEINKWLEEEYWPVEGNPAIKDGGEWVVGEEKGLDCRHGTLWYGGGATKRLGKGF